jgi:type I restriction enzyme S subunit
LSVTESSDLWPEAPQDWKRSRIRNVAVLSPTYSSGTPAPEETCAVIPMEAVTVDGSIDTSNQESFGEISSGLTLFEEGDVLFAKITPCMENGKGAYVSSLPTRYAFGSTEFHVLRPGPCVAGPFLYHLTANPVFRDYAAENMVGAAGQKRVSARFLKDTSIYLPNLSEQGVVARFLEASCSAIDTATEAKRRQIEALDALSKTFTQRAVTRGMSDVVSLEATGNFWMRWIPRNWKLIGLKRIAEIHGGLTLGKQYDGPLVERPYLRVGNVQAGRLDLAEVSVIELPASVAATVELRPGDVLMTEGGDLDKLARGHVWRGEIAPCLHQNHIFAVRCLPQKLIPEFLAYVTAAQYGRDYFEATGKRTTNLACTNATKVGEFPIPLPPLSEQRHICAYLNAKTGELKRLAAIIQSQIETLLAYRKSLIHECVTGQRRITEEGLNRIRRAQADPQPEFEAALACR